jgi:SAM-dependent methyltransferase
MDDMILQGLKSRLTKKAYPHNMHYDVKTLKPASGLQKRKNIIQKNFGTFFTTQKDLRFLDMGCSKGYFSLLGSGMFAEVVSFDKDEEVIQLCKDISDAREANNIEFMCCSHGEFLDSYDGVKFDRVMLGNGPHYPFLERGGHGYIAEIAGLMNSGGELLLEGPLGMECADMKIIPKQLRSIFNKVDFMKEMNRFFLQVDSFVSALNADRYVSLWKRK